MKRESKESGEPTSPPTRGKNRETEETSGRWTNIMKRAIESSVDAMDAMDAMDRLVSQVQLLWFNLPLGLGPEGRC